MTATDQQEQDERFLRRAIELAWQARARGNRPFGAVLVSGDGRVLGEGENTEQSDRDVTGHAETNLLRNVCRTLDAAALADATIYASGEPCPMCAGTIYWSGVRRVIFAASGDRIRELHLPRSGDGPVLRLSCHRDVLAAGSQPSEVIRADAGRGSRARVLRGCRVSSQRCATCPAERPTLLTRVVMVVTHLASLLPSRRRPLR
ncbi:MAG: nucleoside deaminase [Thermomicrobiales bacterium]